MTLQTRTYEEMNVAVAGRMKESLGLDSLTPGRAVTTFITGILDEISITNATLQAVHLGQYLPRATGIHLDLIGETYNVPRLMSTRAFVQAIDANVLISTIDDTPLRSKIGVQVAASTIISSGDGTKSYTVPLTIEIPEGVSTVAIGLAAVDPGTASNVAPGELVNHPFGASIQVTNVEPIDTGTDIEADLSYRSRLAAFVRGNGANASAIRAAALSVSGVTDVILTPTANGINTIGLLILPTSNIVAPSIIEAVRLRIVEVAPLGTNIFVRGPSFKQVELEAMLNFAPGVPAEDADSIANRAVDETLTAIGQVGLGGSLDLQVIYRQLINFFSPSLNSVETLCLRIDGEEVISPVIRLQNQELFIPRPIARPIKFFHGAR